MKNIFYSILFIAILFASCSSLQTVNSLEKEMDWLGGKWIGMGLQIDSPQNPTWKIELNVDMKNKSCLIKYPTLECSGKWVLKSGDTRRAIFTEHITEGKNKCYDGGKLVLTKIDENHISYSFFYPDNNILGAFSTLTKAEYAKKLNSRSL